MKKSLFFLPFISAVAFAQTTVTFAVIGDYGTDNANEDSVSVMIDSWNVDFIITVGDNSYGSNGDNRIGKYYADYIGSYTGSYGPGADTNIAVG